MKASRHLGPVLEVLHMGDLNVTDALLMQHLRSFKKLCAAFCSQLQGEKS